MWWLLQYIQFSSSNKRKIIDFFFQIADIMFVNDNNISSAEKKAIRKLSIKFFLDEREHNRSKEVFREIQEVVDKRLEREERERDKVRNR